MLVYFGAQITTHTHAVKVHISTRIYTQTHTPILSCSLSHTHTHPDAHTRTRRQRRIEQAKRPGGRTQGCSGDTHPTLNSSTHVEAASSALARRARALLLAPLPLPLPLPLLPPPSPLPLPLLLPPPPRAVVPCCVLLQRSLRDKRISEVNSWLNSNALCVDVCVCECRHVGV